MVGVAERNAHVIPSVAEESPEKVMLPNKKLNHFIKKSLKYLLLHQLHLTIQGIPPLIPQSGTRSE